MNNQLAFHEVQFNIIPQGDQPWLTATQIAQALGYSSEKSISNLYRRNAEEFTPCMTLVINSMTNGINNSLRENEIRIFSLRGAHLIAMFSRTERAKEFRRWVLDILDAEVGTATPTKLPSYHFPTETADPHDRRFQNAWMTPKVILDKRNRAPELELLEALQQDGYDVDGVKIRIQAMYGIVKQHIDMQNELETAVNRMASVNDIIKNLTAERGTNVVFGGLGGGKHSPRSLPKR